MGYITAMLRMDSIVTHQHLASFLQKIQDAPNLTTDEKRSLREKASERWRDIAVLRQYERYAQETQQLAAEVDAGDRSYFDYL